MASVSDDIHQFTFDLTFRVWFLETMTCSISGTKAVMSKAI